MTALPGAADTDTSVESLKDALLSAGETALLDVRETLQYGCGHISMAWSTPLSVLEARAAHMLARKTVPIVLCDNRNEVTGRAFEVLKGMGYDNVSALRGGIDAWRAAGFKTFDGTYLVAHAFGVHVARKFGTPSITAEDLKVKMRRGDDLLVIDTRRLDEYRSASVPRSINVPLGELICHIRELVAGSRTEIVIHCGGVTRGTLGAQSLIDLGLENPVHVLQEGVKGWLAAGQEAPEGENWISETDGSKQGSWPNVAGRRLSERGGVRRLSREEFENWCSEAQSRSLYLVDVRTKQEFEAGHFKSARWAPGGELIGMIDDYLPVKNCRICILDDGSGRADLVGYWLTVLNWHDVALLECADEDFCEREDKTGDAHSLSALKGLARISATDLMGSLEDPDVTVIDFSSSAEYEHSHISAAWWMSRAHIESSVSCLPKAKLYVATSNDCLSGYLACRDLARCLSAPVFALDGGNVAWRNRGLSLSSGMQRPCSIIEDDYFHFAMRRNDDPILMRTTSQRIARWRETLLTRIGSDPFLKF